MSITRIYKSYYDFSQRGDKSENGVSTSFSIQNTNWEEDNKTNKGCWNCSHCSNCSHCFCCSHCSHCSRCSRCSHCSDCSHCSHCSRCAHCSDCYDCYDCSHCSGVKHKEGEKELKEALQKVNTIAGGLKVPVIENIHQTVHERVSNPDSLDMSTWHTCDTTHCRAGWVVFLAGNDGIQLEARTSTEFAAMQIYKASSEIKVSPVRFYESNEVAIADIKRCAEEESKLQTN